MDSLTQMALGAAVGGAVLGRRIGPRAFVWGAVCGTLPDLDVLVSHGDPVRDFTFHRATSHAFFYQTLAAPLIAWALHRLHRHGAASYRGWLLLVWLCLVTHAALDAFTVYGTQLLLPFSDYPVGVGSIFIIDPLYTMPLLIGVIAAMVARTRAQTAQRWNTAGLALSTLYLGWTLAAQSHVEGEVHRTLAATGTDHGRVLVTPAPFNSLLWRVVVMDDDGFREGFTSLFDPPGPIELTYYPSRVELLAALRADWSVQRLAWFSKGFYVIYVADSRIGATSDADSFRPGLGPLGSAVAATDASPGTQSHILMADLRMGQVPWFVFTFVVGAVEADGVRTVVPRQLPVDRPAATALAWIWRRIWSASAGPPPRA